MLGVYIGIVFIVIGVGFSLIIYSNKPSAMIVVTILMFIMGILKVIKCLKKKL